MKPYAIRTNGDVLDRETGALIGDVYLSPDGWKARRGLNIDVDWTDTDKQTRWLYGTRWFAAMRLHEAWTRHQKTTNDPADKIVPTEKIYEAP